MLYWFISILILLLIYFPVVSERESESEWVCVGGWDAFWLSPDLVLSLRMNPRGKSAATHAHRDTCTGRDTHTDTETQKHTHTRRSAVQQDECVSYVGLNLHSFMALFCVSWIPIKSGSEVPLCTLYLWSETRSWSRIRNHDPSVTFQTVKKTSSWTWPDYWCSLFLD